MTQKKKKTRTTYYQSRNHTSKNLFHSPQAYGELIKIPMTPALTAVSAVSLGIQLGLTVFAVYAFQTTDTIPALAGSGFASSALYLVLPAAAWLLSFGFRFACAIVPLEMWRLPVRVRQGFFLSEGTLLKEMTLLMELLTAVCFFYITAALYLGGSPSSLVLLLWLAGLVLVIWLPCRKAIRLAEQQRTPASKK